MDKGFRRVISFFNQIWGQYRAVKFYKLFIGKDDLVFDIGANEGRITNLLLKTGGFVISVEPQKKCFFLLKEKFKNNARVTLIRKAISNKIGKSELFIDSNIGEIASLDKNWIKNFEGESFNKKEIVETITLDYLIKKYGLPKFIKIDVEGYELKVFEGLSKKVNLLCFEHTTKYIERTNMCIDLLVRLGFKKFNYSKLEEFKFEKNWMSEKQMKEFILNLELVPWGDIYAR